MARSGSLFHALSLSLSAGYNAAKTAFVRHYDDPSTVEGGVELGNRAAYYSLLWSYYDNSAFEDMVGWASYKSTYRLYRQIVSLYNPARRLADFYAGQVYPGVLSEDGKRLPQGIPLAVPLADDTPPELKTAISTFWRWTNWQAAKSVFVRYGAICGNVLVELVDDVDAGKVSADVVWPGLVSYLDLSPAGNLRAYALQYLAYDDTGMRYVYRKEVDKDLISTYRDGQLWDYTGAGAQYPNPYGFVPAVWCKHRDIGGNYGAPCTHGSLGKIDKLNNLASMTHNQVSKMIAAPILVATSGSISNLIGTGKQTNRRPTDELVEVDDDRESVLMWKGPADTRVESLAGKLDPREVLPLIESLQKEIENDHPELAMYAKLRDMTQVTGPAAQKMMGDVAQAVGEASANYDAASVSLFRMAIAIAGMRANAGDWSRAGPLTRHQQAFLPFDLSSYAAGQLDFDIVPRALIPLTAFEELELQQLRTSVEAGVQATLAANMREAIPS